MGRQMSWRCCCRSVGQCMHPSPLSRILDCMRVYLLASLTCEPRHDDLPTLANLACGLTLDGPPNELAMLLPVCRAVHASLSAQQNPGLHARIFAGKFDLRAPTRRLADAGQPLTARVSNAGRLLVCSEDHEREDLWLIYLMFIESDGHNLKQLEWAQVNGYLRTVVREQLMPSSKPGYMIESTPRALGLWLMWFLTEVYS
ncbi:hypothetical protein RSAG8_12150, partial [Rhizoctonia solani AG-8 WAC10335]